MLDPYENILIGNFLYSLGLVIGKRTPTTQLAGAINLLQQTPMDGALGDVLIGYPGIIRLIEFKRKSNKSKKEANKHELLIAALKEKSTLRAVSRTVHWYVETAEDPLEWTTRICPYIDFDKENQNERSSLKEFTEQLADTALSAVKSEFPEDQITIYLQLVAALSKRDGSSSGLLVSINGDGTLRYIAIENIRDLSTELRRHQSMAQEASNQIVQLREKSREITHRRNGPSYDR